MPENPAAQTQAPKAAKKPKPIDIFLALSSQDLLNLLHQKTVTMTKNGVSFAFSLGEFDSEDVTRLEAATEALEEMTTDLTDEDDSEFEEDGSEFDDDSDDDDDFDEDDEEPDEKPDGVPDDAPEEA